MASWSGLDVDPTCSQGFTPVNRFLQLLLLFRFKKEDVDLVAPRIRGLLYAVAYPSRCLCLVVKEGERVVFIVWRCSESSHHEAEMNVRHCLSKMKETTRTSSESKWAPLTAQGRQAAIPAKIP